MKDSLKITVIGDIMLDRYWFGSAKRISPEAPIPVINVKTQEDRLGGAANVALNISTLEKTVALVGMIGTDHEGALLRALCTKHTIDTHFIENSAHTTITKLRIISQHQHMLRCDFEEPLEASLIDSEGLKSTVFSAIDQADIIVFSDYGKGFLADPEPFIAYAKEQNKIILIDPKGTNFTKYKGATLLTPNRGEFEEVVGVCQNEEELLVKGENLRQSLDLQALLITRSDEGMTLIEQGKAPITYLAKTRDVYDVTGAGDTVLALLATSLAEGKTLNDAALIANIGASIVVGKLGASQVTPDELRAALGETERAHHQIMTKAELKSAIAKAKKHNERVVMTNGCFDLLHRGHVAYLEKARALGDRLIVALNTDASVKRLKGDARPIMDELSRATVLASLSSVDWVILFDEETPESLITELLPDILVKGSDYSVENIAGANAVINSGGRVELIDFIEGYSTTAAINKIKNS